MQPINLINKIIWTMLGGDRKPCGARQGRVVDYKTGKSGGLTAVTIRLFKPGSKVHKGYTGKKVVLTAAEIDKAELTHRGRRYHLVLLENIKLSPKRKKRKKKS